MRSTTSIDPFRLNIRRLAAVALVALLVTVARGQTITKCQDEEGNWHYGDHAAEACAKDSDITEIDERGITVKETEAPPTEEELEAKEAAERQEQMEAERRAQQEARDRRLLRTYDSEQDIIDARDDHVDALDRDLKSHRLFRQDLVDAREELENHEENQEQIKDLEQRIERYDEAIEALEKKKQAMVKEYSEELKRYRELAAE